MFLSQKPTSPWTQGPSAALAAGGCEKPCLKYVTGIIQQTISLPWSLHGACGEDPTSLGQPPVDMWHFSLLFPLQSFPYAGKVANLEGSLPLPAWLPSRTEGLDAFALCHLSASCPQTPVSEPAWFFTDFIKINKGLVAVRSY